ncbi:MAG: sigma-70 family RNA polymerase sigma factor [Polyangiaceae bacterium]|nr:sigma-70 family RNA polymerase sigma factor [Polyangiaceae bacterium]
MATNKHRAPTPMSIGNRLATGLAHSYFGAFGGTIPLSDLQSFANEGLAHALRVWNGKGRFEPFCAQRIRWAILRLVKRQILRHLKDERQRAGACALLATERVAEAYEDSFDGGEAATLPNIQEMTEQSLSAYRLELASVAELDAVADPSADVEEAAQRGELRRAVARLPAPEDVVVALFTYEGLTFQEIGEQLSMGRSTVHEAYWRGRDRLEQWLSPKPRTTVFPAEVVATL